MSKVIKHRTNKNKDTISQPVFDETTKRQNATAKAFKDFQQCPDTSVYGKRFEHRILTKAVKKYE